MNFPERGNFSLLTTLGGDLFTSVYELNLCIPLKEESEIERELTLWPQVMLAVLKGAQSGRQTLASFLPTSCVKECLTLSQSTVSHIYTLLFSL